MSTRAELEIAQLLTSSFTASNDILHQCNIRIIKRLNYFRNASYCCSIVKKSYLLSMMDRKNSLRLMTVQIITRNKLKKILRQV